MTTTLILIRHGETIWNRERKLMGIMDIPLTAEGKRQAAKVATHLRSYPLDVIFTSPLTRALDTARKIYHFHPKIALITKNELRERDFGSVEGFGYEEVNSIYPELIYSESWKYLHFRPKGGESLADLCIRADKFLSVILPLYEGKNIAVVSHGTFLRVLICRVLSLSLTDYSPLYMNNTGITILELSKKFGGTIHAANYTAHLPDLTIAD